MLIPARDNGVSRHLLYDAPHQSVLIRLANALDKSGADMYLMLTDVNAVYRNWGKPSARAIRRASPDALEEFSFAAGSMGPKVESACEFVRKTGGVAAIGALEDAVALVHGEAGTIITTKVDRVEWGDNRE